MLRHVWCIHVMPVVGNIRATFLLQMNFDSLAFLMKPRKADVVVSSDCLAEARRMIGSRFISSIWVNMVEIYDQ